MDSKYFSLKLSLKLFIVLLFVSNSFANDNGFTTAYTQASSSNLRTNSVPNAEIVKKLLINTEVNILEEKSEWVFIQVATDKSVQGWLHQSLIGAQPLSLNEALMKYESFSNTSSASLTWIERAAAIAPSDKEVLNKLVKTLEHHGEYERAKHVLENMTQLPPTYSIDDWLKKLVFSETTKISEEGRLQLTLISSGKIEVTDLVDKRTLAIITSTIKSPTLLSVSSNGKILAIADGKGNIEIWDVIDNSLTDTINGPKVEKIALSQDGEWLAIQLNDNSVQIRNTKSKGPAYYLDSLRGSTFINIKFSPDGKILATAELEVGHYESNYYITLWDVATGKELMVSSPQAIGNMDIYANMAFSPNGKWLVYGDAYSGYNLHALNLDECNTPLQIGDSRDVTAALFSEDSNTLYAAEFPKYEYSEPPSKIKGVFKAWDLKSKRLIFSVELLDTPVIQLIPEMADDQLILRTKKNELYKLNTKLLKALGSGDDTVEIKPFPRQKWSVTTCTSSGDYKSNASKRPKKSEILNPELIASLGIAPKRIHYQLGPQRNKFGKSSRELREITALALNHQGNLLADSSKVRHYIALWDVSNPDQPLLNTFQFSNPSYPKVLAFSPDSRWLVSGFPDGGVELWDIKQEKNINLNVIRKYFPIDFTFSHNGQRLLSLSKIPGKTLGRAVTVFDLSNNRELFYYEFVKEDHSGKMLSWKLDNQPVTISTHGNWLAHGLDKISVVFIGNEETKSDDVLQEREHLILDHKINNKHRHHKEGFSQNRFHAIEEHENVPPKLVLSDSGKTGVNLSIANFPEPENMATSGNGQWLVADIGSRSGSREQEGRWLINLEGQTGNQIWPYYSHSASSLRFNEDSDLLYSYTPAYHHGKHGGYHRDITIWQLKNITPELLKPTSCWSDSCNLVLNGRNNILGWSLNRIENESEKEELVFGSENQAIKPFRRFIISGNSSELNQFVASFNDSGDHFAWVDREGIHLWHMQFNRDIAQIPRPVGRPLYIKPNISGKQLVSIWENNGFQLRVDKVCTKPIDRTESRVINLDFYPEMFFLKNDLFFIISDVGEGDYSEPYYEIWDLKAGVKVASGSKWLTPDNTSESGTLAALNGHRNSEVTVVDLLKDTQPVKFSRHPGADVYKFSPNETMLATGSKDGSIKIWDVKTGRELALLKESSFRIIEIAISDMQNMLAARDLNGTIHVWDIRQVINERKLSKY